MGISRTRKWLAIVRPKFLRSTREETIIILHTNDTASNTTQLQDSPSRAAVQNHELNDITTFLVSSTHDRNLSLTEEDIAAIKIQSYFRRHLARRAFRALRSLVKLQAVVRGVCVRRQARIAMHCMHTLTRLQITVRARQLLSREM